MESKAQTTQPKPDCNLVKKDKPEPKDVKETKQTEPPPKESQVAQEEQKEVLEKVCENNCEAPKQCCKKTGDCSCENSKEFCCLKEDLKLKEEISKLGKKRTEIPEKNGGPLPGENPTKEVNATES